MPRAGGSAGCFKLDAGPGQQVVNKGRIASGGLAELWSNRPVIRRFGPSCAYHMTFRFHLIPST
jgi:hypothetical protein